MNLIETEEITLRYDQPQNIESDCLDITFFNAGTKTCFINGFPLAAGQQKVTFCNQGEILRTKYQLAWPIGGVLTQDVIVIRRIYKKYN